MAKADVQNQTGLKVDPIRWARQKDRQAKLEAQSEIIADVLMRYGVNPYRPDGDKTKLHLVTGVCERAAAAYRNINFIPVVAAANRSKNTRDFEMFLSEYDPKGFSRYAVFTTGERCHVLHINARKEELNRRLNQWSHDLCKPLGIEVLLKTWEFTWNADGFHVHCNVIYKPEVRIDKWASFIGATRGFFSAHMQDNGRLKNAREAIKYCVKGDDLGQLAQHDPEALAKLAAELKGKRLVVPQGAFKTWCKALKDDDLKVVRDYFGRGGQFVESALKIVPKIKSDKDDSQDLPPLKNPVNTIIAQIKPAPGPTAYLEPSLLIHNADLATLHQNGRYRRLLREAREAFEANSGGVSVQDAIDQAAAARAAYRVHNYTTTLENRDGKHDRNDSTPGIVWDVFQDFSLWDDDDGPIDHDHSGIEQFDCGIWGNPFAADQEIESVAAYGDEFASIELGPVFEGGFDGWRAMKTVDGGQATQKTVVS